MRRESEGDEREEHEKKLLCALIPTLVAFLSFLLSIAFGFFCANEKPACADELGKTMLHRTTMG